MSKEDIDYWLEQRVPDIKKNLKVIDFSEIGNLYHLSTFGKIKEFTPRISTGKYLVNEDLTTPRISVSDCLFGCFNGAFNPEDDFVNQPVDREYYSSSSQGKYLGGYYIYSFDYEYAIKPNQKIINDTLFINEYWLVTYNKETIKYVPKIVGKVFVNKITIGESLKGKHRLDKKNVDRGEIEFCLEIDIDDFKLTVDKSVNKGKYILSTSIPCYIDINNKKLDINITEIAEAEYKKNKKLNASLLNYTEPNFLKW